MGKMHDHLSDVITTQIRGLYNIKNTYFLNSHFTNQPLGTFVDFCLHEAFAEVNETWTALLLNGW